MTLNDIGSDKTSRTMGLDCGGLSNDIGVRNTFICVYMVSNIPGELLQIQLLLETILNVSLVSSNVEVLVFDFLIDACLH